nr:acyltransferase [Paenibacillus alba]
MDSLRGLAAVCVVFLHMYLIVPWDRLFKIVFEFTPLRLFISGGEAVILFFVLSGFVLSLPYYKNKQINYFHFMLKRIFRIYIPYIVSFIFFIIGKEMLYSGKVQGLSNWFNSFWSSPITTKTILEHSIMIDSFMSNLNPVVWSLVHEMRISLLFPILMIPLVKLNWKKNLALCVLFSAIGVLIFLSFKPSNNGTEIAATFNYTTMFIVGALLAKYRENISRRYRAINNLTKIAIFMCGIFIYLFIHPSFAVKLLLFPNISPFFRTVIDSWAVMLGAVILIIFALNSTVFSKILSYKLVNYLGKISYSLYLVHIAVIFASIHVLNGIIPLWGILIIALCITFILSTMMYKYVELPSIKLGKILVNKMTKNPDPANITQNELPQIKQTSALKNL